MTASSACGLRRRCSRSSRGYAGRRARSSRSRSPSRSAFAELADAAKLAPIVGAFVAGLALVEATSPIASGASSRRSGTSSSRCSSSRSASTPTSRRSRSRRCSASPRCCSWSRSSASSLRPLGRSGSPGDRLLIGLGMLPRGEVGLIFATIGLGQAISGNDEYAALLLVVLVSTLLTPPVLRWRLENLRRASAPAVGPQMPRPEGGWLVLTHTRGSSGVIDLAGTPPIGDALAVGLQAALMLDEEHRPGELLVEWLGQLPPAPLRFDRSSRDVFFELLARGRPRSWRFLQITGLLERALPELGDAIRRREPSRSTSIRSALCTGRPSTRITASSSVAIGTSPACRSSRVGGARCRRRRCERRVGAARPARARRVMQRLDLGASAEQAVAGLVADVGCCVGAALRARRVGRGDGVAARRPPGFPRTGATARPAHAGGRGSRLGRASAARCTSASSSRRRWRIPSSPAGRPPTRSSSAATPPRASPTTPM